MIQPTQTDLLNRPGLRLGDGEPRWLQQRSGAPGVVWLGYGLCRLWRFIRCILSVPPPPLCPGPNSNVCVTQQGGCPHQQAILRHQQGVELSSVLTLSTERWGQIPFKGQSYWTSPHPTHPALQMPVTSPGCHLDF